MSGRTVWKAYDAYKVGVKVIVAEDAGAKLTGTIVELTTLDDHGLRTGKLLAVVYCPDNRPQKYLRIPVEDLRVEV